MDPILVCTWGLHAQHFSFHMLSFILSFLLIGAFASAAQYEHYSTPSSDVWYNSTRIVADPSFVTNYTIVMREAGSTISVNGSLCTPIFNMTSSEYICMV